MMAGMDDVFRALAHPVRRSLLDELFREDGQTLGALEGRLALSRFGVMQHLRHHAQHGIANQMAELIVDALEVIHVEHDH